MATKVKTYVLTNVVVDSNISITGLLTADGLSLGYYGGFLYQIFSAGDSNVYPFASGSHGPGSGFMNSGYIDLTHPYPVSDILVQNFSLNMSLALYFPSGSGDPTNGAYPMVIRAEQGTTYENNNIVDSNNIPFPSDYIRTGFYNGGSIQNSGILQNQRGTFPPLVTVTGDGTLISNIYGEGLAGGGGFYGTNNTNLNGFGYFSGTKGDTNLKNYGYVVISLIPVGFFVGTAFLTDTTEPKDYVTTSNENFILYSLMGGGGGGGFQQNNRSGSGGGGSGDWISGLLYTSNGQKITLNIGEGGPGAPDTGEGGIGAPGSNGGNTNITYNTSNTSNIIDAKGGIGGAEGYGDGNQDGNGGAGYFAGGGGSSNANSGGNSLGGDSYVLIPSYYGGTGNRSTDFKIGGNGAGSVNYTFNNNNYIFGVASQAAASSYDNSSGGGGGGFWGGNGTVNGDVKIVGDGTYFIDARGYGGGGGGGGAGRSEGGTYKSTRGGFGSQGFGLLKYFDNTNPELKFYKVTQTQIFDIADYRNAVGVWCFLGGDSGKSYHNTFHFLIKQDGVKYVKCIKGSSGFTINIFFDTYNNQPQIFNLDSTATDTNPYMMLMFYY